MTDIEKLVDLVKDFPLDYETCQKAERRDCSDKPCAECLAEHLLANGVTVPRWISVTEQLPEVGVAVRFRRENKICGVGMYSDTYRCFFAENLPVVDVTHWRPCYE